GAIQKSEYLNQIDRAGFVQVKLQKEKPIVIPDDILIRYLNAEQIALLKKGDFGIFSITVYAEKPAEAKACCTPGSGCC
ncbi:MAG: hypothetical protein RLY16_73, partial [Bacteroidota bacterium]